MRVECSMGCSVGSWHHVSTSTMCGSMVARRATSRNALHLLGVQIVHAGDGSASARSCALALVVLCLDSPGGALSSVVDEGEVGRPIGTN